jgi:hypothetical protein
VDTVSLSDITALVDFVIFVRLAIAIIVEVVALLCTGNIVWHTDDDGAVTFFLSRSTDAVGAGVTISSSIR